MITVVIKYINEYHPEYNHNNIIEGETEDSIFEQFYKKNNQLRYCNGSYYKFDDNEITKKYYEWVKQLSSKRGFNLYYSGSFVD